ncbi:hypothetical protein LDENG_00143130 [Lucifuga dentata]|nr:hypothetical protein LDENG_00143130 [Lucifuga dentata]
MFTQRHTRIENAFLSAVAVLLLIVTAGQSATLSDNSQPTNTADLTNSTESSPTTHTNSSGMEEPLVQRRTHSPCPEKYADYCHNGGQCMFPQDNIEPSCICQSSYHGPRCLLFTIDGSHSPSKDEKIIGISVGVVMFVIVLAIIIIIIIYCCVHKRCRKSAPLIKPAASESSV